MGGFGGIFGKLLSSGLANDIGPVRFSDPASYPTSAVDPASGLRLPAIDENGPVRAGIAPSDEDNKPVLRAKPPSKFHRLMEFVAPILQGAMYGLGTAQPTRGIGAGGFGPAMGQAFERTQQHGLQMGLMGHQLAMEEQDRALRRAMLENTMRHQGVVEQGIMGRLGEQQKRTEDAGAWGQPFEADMPNGQRGLFQQHSKTGDIRPVMLPGAAGIVPGQPPTLGAQAPTAPLAAGGAQGAAPAFPSGIRLPGALGASQALAPAATGAPGTVPGPAGPVSGQLTRTKPQKEKEPSEKQQDIADYLEANKLQDTAANREKARLAIATRVPAFNFNVQTGGAPLAGAPAAANAGKTGTDLQNSVPANIKSTVMAILEGRMSAPGSFALKQPYWQNVMNNVLALDPQWSEQRAQLRKAYTTGPQSKEINAINTALGHVGALGEAIDALNNGQVQVLNRIANAYNVQVGKTPVTTLQTIVNRVGPELVKAYAGTAGGQEERKRVESDFDPKLSPVQLRTNVSTTASLLRSKIASLENQWNQNSAPGVQPFQERFIMPAAKSVIDKWAAKGSALSNFHVNPQTGERIGWDGAKWVPAPTQQ